MLGQLSEVYAGYFASLSDQGRYGDAFRVIEKARGRVEAQALAHHEVIAPHEPTTAEQHLVNLNLQLLKTDEESERGHILQAVYDTEQQLGSSPKSNRVPPEPVDLKELQHDLRPTELLLEYVLDEPNSYALAITTPRSSIYAAAEGLNWSERLHTIGPNVVQQKADLASHNSSSAISRAGFRNTNRRRPSLWLQMESSTSCPFLL